MSFPRYPAYKDSGVEWLGQVPSDWTVIPAKYGIASKSGGQATKNTVSPEPGDGLFPAFSASGQDIWMEDFEFDGPALVLSAVGARCGKTFKADGRWGVVANTHCLFPRAAFDRDFLWYLTNREEWWERGGTAQPFVKVSETLARKWVFPPPGEQALIGRFLDRETAKLDALVAEQELLITLLKEKRQAVISHAVTKGLDPSVPMKDSGVDWLGEVPAHWEIKKVSLSFRARKGSNAAALTKEYCSTIEGEYPVYSGQTENAGVMASISSYEFDAHEAGVLFSTTVGAKAMTIMHILDKFSLSQNCMIIAPIVDLHVRFFFYHMQPLFHYERGLIPEHMQASFRMEDLYAYRIASPNFDEQVSIAKFLDERCAAFDALIDEAEKNVSLLKERRSAIISAAVTGQIDIRGESNGVKS